MAKRDPETLTTAGVYVRDYEHPDTGEMVHLEVEIPTGSTVVRNGDTIDTLIGPHKVEVDGVEDGEILFWHSPPASEPHPDLQPGYVARLARDGTARWVLAAITDEVDITDLGPRNTLSAITYFLATNRDAAGINLPSLTVLARVAPGVILPDLPREQTAEGQVEALLGELEALGFVEDRGDSYAVTAAGRVELSN